MPCSSLTPINCDKRASRYRAASLVDLIRYASLTDLITPMPSKFAQGADNGLIALTSYRRVIFHNMRIFG